MIRRPVGFVSLFTAAALLNGGQDGPRFQTGTHLVQINVLVRDKNGPVSNLTRDDFILTDKGKPQRITVFSVSTRQVPPAPGSALPENTFSNRTYGGDNPGSVTVVLLDRLNTLTSNGPSAWEDNAKWSEAQALANAKQHLVKFVKQMDAKDRVAIYSLAQSLTVLSDFTGDREQLLHALNSYSATSVTKRETVEPNAVHTPVPGDFNGSIDRERQALANLANADRSRITMLALHSIAAHMAAIPGRKSLVWLTANLPFSGDAAARALGRSDVAVYPMDARGLLTKALFAPIDDSGAVAGGLGSGTAGVPGSRPTGQSTMEEIAQDTGGRAFINTNDLAEAIHAAVEDGAVSYTLGFYPGADTIDGKFHELKVRVKPAHLELRYPRGYFAIQDAPSPQTESRLLEAVESPLEAANIHMLARIERVRPNSISMSATIDLHQIELAPSGELQKGSVQILIVQQDAAGRVIGRESKTLHLELSKENYAELLKTGVFFREIVAAKDGLATLRILVADPANATTGSLIIPVSQIK